MRGPRIKEEGQGFYHIVSRIVDRRRVLDTKEKERFRDLMRRVEAFSGVQILTYTILDNHFHILLMVPPRREVSDEEFLVRMACLYDETVVQMLARELKVRREEKLPEAAEAMKARWVARMYDLSAFMKTLKQRITQSYNRRHGRVGTLWEERFKSILVQGRPGALGTVAAYIDLNAVRAGIVGDPKDYRFSGYGEAMGGGELARNGLGMVMGTLGQPQGWHEAATAYRQLVYVAGEAQGLDRFGNPTRPGFKPEVVRQVLEAGGQLSLPELLRCRVRYFTDGVVMGTEDYVEGVFEKYRARFGEKRESGARPMRGGFAQLFTARRLRLNVITIPATG